MSTQTPRSAITDGTLLEALDDATPAIMLNGQTNDVFATKNGTFVPAIAHLCEQAIAREYDIVVVYSPVEHRLRFGDEVVGTNPTMRSTLANMELRVLDTTQTNLMPILLNDEVTSLESIRGDQVILRMVERAMAHESQPKICLIIDDAHAYVQRDTASGRGVRAEELDHFVQRLQNKPGNHLLLIDKRNTVHLDGDVAVHNVCGTTKEDVHAILNGKSDVLKNPEVETLAQGVPVKVLRKLAKDAKLSTPEDFMRALRAAKEASIAALAGNVVRCAIPTPEDTHVAMHEGEAEFWASEAKLLQRNAKMAAQGCLLMGPPGTGKSLRARYLAQSMGIPYLTLTDTGSQGLRGIKLAKYQQAFAAAIQIKPCVLFIDELDKEFPNTERDERSNDDAEVAAYVQRTIGSPEMQGVYIVAGTNNPESMNTALLRSGRFGNRMAVLPPQSEEEKIELLQSVLQRMCPGEPRTKAYLASIVKHIPDGAAGSDYQELVRRAAVNSDDDQEGSLNRSLRDQLSTFQWTTIAPANEDMQEIALRMDTVSTWRRAPEAKKTTTGRKEEMTLADWEDALGKREHALKGQEKKQAKLTAAVKEQEEILAELEKKVADKRTELKQILTETRAARRTPTSSPATHPTAPTDGGVSELITRLRTPGANGIPPLTQIPEISHEENMRRLGELKKRNLRKENCSWQTVGADGIINVRGTIEIHDPTFTDFPHNIRVTGEPGFGGTIDLRGSGVRYMPYAWAYRLIDLSDTPVEILDPRIGTSTLKLTNTPIRSIPLTSARSPNPDSSNDTIYLRDLYVEHTAVTSLPSTFTPRMVYYSSDNEALDAYLKARAIEGKIIAGSSRRPACVERKNRELIDEAAIREILGDENVIGLEELEKTFGKKAVENLEVPTLPRWMVELAKEEECQLRLRLGPISIEDMLKKSHVKRYEVISPDSWIPTASFNNCATTGTYWAKTKKYASQFHSRNYIYEIHNMMRHLEHIYGDDIPQSYRDASQQLTNIDRDIIELMERVADGTARNGALNQDKIMQCLGTLRATALTHYDIASLAHDLIVFRKTGKGPLQKKNSLGPYRIPVIEEVRASSYLYEADLDHKSGAICLSRREGANSHVHSAFLYSERLTPTTKREE